MPLVLEGAAALPGLRAPGHTDQLRGKNSGLRCT